MPRRGRFRADGRQEEVDGIHGTFVELFGAQQRQFPVALQKQEVADEQDNEPCRIPIRLFGSVRDVLAEQVGKLASETIRPGRHEAGHEFRMVRCFGPQQPVEGEDLRPGDEVEVCAGEGPQATAQRSPGRRPQCVHGVEHTGALPLDHSRQERRLATEMRVERHAGHAGRGGNLLESDRAHASLVEESLRGIENRHALFRILRPSRAPPDRLAVASLHVDRLAYWTLLSSF